MRNFKYLTKLDYQSIRAAVGSLLDGGGFLNKCGLIRDRGLTSQLMNQVTEVGYWVRINSEMPESDIVDHVRTMELAKRRVIEEMEIGLIQLKEQEVSYRSLADNLESISLNPSQVKIEMFEEIIRWHEALENLK